MPLEGYATRDDWLCSQRIAKRSCTTSTRLQALLEKQGPLHISELPYAWNATYGEASRMENRPVRSASKDCSPPHVTGIKIVNRMVYAVEELVAGDMHSHMIQTDDEFLKHLSAEAAHLIDLEFEAVVAGYEVTTAFASLVGTSSSTWLASITRCAFRWEKENDEHDEQKEREEDVVAQAFGPRPEDALLVAKGRLLEQLGRWNDQPNTELVNATVLLNMLQSHSSLLLQDRSTSVCQDFDKHLRALVSLLCELLKQPPMCHAACWALIGKVWPIVLSAQNSEGMQRLVSAAKKCPVKPTIAVWARLAEAAA